MTHDYTWKSGIVHAEILLPDHAPKEFSERAILWNSVEQIERYKTAQLAREIELALPKELTKEQNISLVREYVQSHFVAVGMCADIAIHNKGDGNPHAHIMLTMRPIEKDGKWGAKSHTENGKKIPTVDWNEQTKSEEWREGWAVAVNKVLERENIVARIDHRSYKRQGIDIIPTVHLGVASHQMEQRGIRTDRGNINREIGISNQNLRQLKARIVKLQNWLSDIPKEPNLADVVQGILGQQDSSHYAKIRGLKSAAETLAFLQENKIKDMPDLNEKLKSMFVKQQNIVAELKPIERRLKVLDEHLKQVAEYKKSKTPSSKAYLDRHLNGRKSIPTKAWKDERERLLGEKSLLGREYQNLKAEIGQVDKIRRVVYDLLPRESVKVRGVQR